MSQDAYDELRARARKLAAEKRASGEMPERITEMLDDLFEEVAPPGARAKGDGLEALVEVLARYNFDPTIPAESTREGVGWAVKLVKRVLRPITSWQLRHVTDQLNAYMSAQTEILRELIRKIDGSSSD